MSLTFERLGKYIHEVDVRNTDISITKLMGVNLSKQMMPSVANIVGTDLSTYKVVKNRQFACKLMSVGRDACLPIALKLDNEPVIISSAYYAFEVNDEHEMMPEYLMMCFLRPDFDRELWFKTGGDVRGGVTWETFCDMKIPVVPIDKQHIIVHNYQVVTDRIALLQGINDKLCLFGSAYFHKLKNEDENNGNPWESCTVGQLVDRGYIYSPVDGNHGEIHPKASDYVSYGVPFIMANNIIDGFVDYINCAFITEKQAKNLRKGFSKPGDVLLTHKATIGRTAIVSQDFETTILTPQVTYYRPRKTITSSFLKYYFDSAEFQQSLKAFSDAGSTRAYIGITEQLKLPMLLPNQKSLNKLTEVLNRLESMRLMNNYEINHLQRLKSLVAHLS